MVQKKRGQVKFNPPAAQLSAELPGDEEMREQLEEMKMNDGFEGSCGLKPQNERTTKSEKLRYENADEIYE